MDGQTTKRGASNCGWITTWALTNYWGERAREIAENPSYENEFMNQADRIKHELAEVLKDEHEEQAEPVISSASWIADLLNSAIQEVNWREIAEALIEDWSIELEAEDEAEVEV